MFGYKKRLEVAEIIKETLIAVLKDYAILDGAHGHVMAPEKMAKLLTFHIDKVLKEYEQRRIKGGRGVISPGAKQEI